MLYFTQSETRLTSTNTKKKQNKDSQKQSTCKPTISQCKRQSKCT